MLFFTVVLCKLYWNRKFVITQVCMESFRRKFSNILLCEEYPLDKLDKEMFKSLF